LARCDTETELREMKCRKVSAVIVLLALALLPLGMLFHPVQGLGQWKQAELPQHTNHTFPNISAQSERVRLEVVALGDVKGERQIILWLRATNRGSDELVLLPEAVRIEVGDGRSRICYYHSYSQVIGEVDCEGMLSYEFHHTHPRLEPGENLSFWIVYRLPRYLYEWLGPITMTYPPEGIRLSFAVSADRQPQQLPYIVISKPRGETWNLRDVVFRVMDTDQWPLALNWTILIDGKLAGKGQASLPRPPSGSCPFVVATRLPSIDLEPGWHQLTVKTWDGHIQDAETVLFSTPAGSPGLIPLRNKWEINTSAVFQGMTFGGGYQSPQTVWDVDADGETELLFATRRGDSRRLWCFGPGPKLEWVYPPISQQGLLGDPMSKASLVDVDRDGFYEICIAGRGGRLSVIDGFGNLIWTWDEPSGGSIKGAPQAFDVDGDGHPEFFLNSETEYLYRVEHDGKTAWRFPTGGQNSAHPTICDIDQDGAYEVIWTCRDHNVYCVDAVSGYEKWRLDAGASMRSNVIVADVDRDGAYEAVTWTDAPESAVICIDPWGEEKWRWRSPEGGNIRLSQAMGDVNRDGSIDLVLMTTDCAYALSIGTARPSLIWQINFTALSQATTIPPGARCSHYSSYQLLADLDCDGELEILWLVPYPVVTDAATGRPEAYYLNQHIHTDRRADNGGWWGDIDQDGVSEWICELTGWTHRETQTYCLTMGGSFPGYSPWPEYYHSAYPAEYQESQEWLTLKAAYSNSLWFPIPEGTQWPNIGIILFFVTTASTRSARRKSPDRSKRSG